MQALLWFFTPLNIEMFNHVGSAMLSRDPSLGSFEVLASGSESVDKFWTVSKTLMHSSSVPQSLIFYKDRIIGVCQYGGIGCLDVINGDNGSGRIEFREIIAKGDIYYRDCFLSETTFGDLLVIHRNFDDREKCEKYKVFKLIESDGQVPRLVTVDDLDGHSIFLFYVFNRSISVLASNYVGYCRPNSIYYQYRNWRMSSRTTTNDCDIEIEEFNLEDQSCHIHRVPIPLETWWVVPSMAL